MRSLLFVPGDSERKIAKALGSAADVIILDLEDSVAPERKQAARELTAEVLGTPHSAGGPRRYVRINPLASGLTGTDLNHILPADPDGVMQPKTASGSDVTTLAGMIQSQLPVIAIATETAAAMFNLGTYAGARPPLTAMAWGAEDLSNELGATTSRDDDGHLTDPYRLARTLCLVGACAAGVDPIDTVYVNFRDPGGLTRECEAAARDGFTGKMAIHPDQIEIINQAFTPPPDAIDRAQRIITAFADAGQPGVISLDGEMHDIPHLKRAENLISRAKVYGKVNMDK